MAASVRSSQGTNFTTATTSFAAAMPPTVNVGDPLVAVVNADSKSATATTPTGWTLVDDISTSVSLGNRTRVYVRVADGTEGATVTWTLSASRRGSVTIVAVAGGNPDSPIGAHGTQDNATSSTSHVAPSLAAPIAGGLLIAGASAFINGSYTVPGAMNEEADQANVDTTTVVATEAVGAAGATGTRTFTASAAQSSIAFAVYVNPAVATTPRGAQSGSGTNSAVVSVPSGSDGDLLFMSGADVGGSLTTPSGWTQIGTSQTIGTRHVWFFWRIASSEPASYTLSAPGASTTRAIIARFGMPGTPVLDAGAVQLNSTSSTSATPPSVTTATANDLEIVAYGAANSSATFTPPDMYTEPANGDTQGSGLAYNTVGRPAGTFTPGAATISSSQSNVVCVAAFNASTITTNTRAASAAIRVQTTQSRSAPAALQASTPAIVRAAPAAIRVQTITVRAAPAALAVQTTQSRSAPATIRASAPGLTRAAPAAVRASTPAVTRSAPAAIRAQTTTSRAAPAAVAALVASTKSAPAAIAVQTTQTRSAPTAIAATTTGNQRTAPAAIRAGTTSARTAPAALAVLTTTGRSAPAAILASTPGGTQTRTAPTSIRAATTETRTAPAALAVATTIGRSAPAAILVGGGATRTAPAAIRVQTTSAKAAPAAIAASTQTVKTAPLAIRAAASAQRSAPAAIAALTASVRSTAASLLVQTTETRSAPAAIAAALTHERSAPAAIAAGTTGLRSAPAAILVGVDLFNQTTHVAAALPKPQAGAGLPRPFDADAFPRATIDHATPRAFDGAAGGARRFEAVAIPARSRP